MFHKSNSDAHLVSCLILVLGIILVLIGQLTADVNLRGINVGGIFSSIGTFVTIVIVMQFLYDNYVREAQFKEIISTIIKSANVRDAGLSDFFPDSKDIRYNNLIKDSENIEIFLHTSPRIIKDYIREWEDRFANKKHATFYFIDENSKAAEYLTSAGFDLTAFRSNLQECLSELEKIDAHQAYLSIKRHRYILSYNVFKFDQIIFMVINTSSKQRDRVPALQICPNSPMWDFIVRDIERIKRNVP